MRRISVALLALGLGLARGAARPLLLNESFARMRNEKLGMKVRRIKIKSAAEC